MPLRGSGKVSEEITLKMRPKADIVGVVVVEGI